FTHRVGVTCCGKSPTTPRPEITRSAPAGCGRGSGRNGGERVKACGEGEGGEEGLGVQTPLPCFQLGQFTGCTGSEVGQPLQDSPHRLFVQPVDVSEQTV